VCGAGSGRLTADQQPVCLIRGGDRRLPLDREATESASQAALFPLAPICFALFGIKSWVRHRYWDENAPGARGVGDGP
jgi:hypothetical protein